MGRPFVRGAFASFRSFFVLTGILGIFAAQVATAGTNLFLIGGGNLPNEALGRFSKLGGGANGNVLVISWATDEDPNDDFQWMTECLKQGSPNDIPKTSQAPTVANVRANKTAFIQQLTAASAVFFTGGDQSHIMDLLSDPGFSDIADIMRGKFENGIPFGGTSAGMAIMSKEMFTGGENPALIDPTQPNFFRPGLGLIQGVMVDAHFIVRQRENRFFSYLLGHDIPLGFGIDEDGVMQVKDNVTAEVIGNKQVMVADMIEHPGDLLIKILRPGDVYDIPKRRRISEGVTGKVAPLCTAAHGSHIFSKSSGM